jgi:hypothetical protein
MGKAVPCTFALLPNKSKTTYLRLAESVKEKLSSLPTVEMSTIMMDFETGLVNAFKERIIDKKYFKYRHYFM